MSGTYKHFILKFSCCSLSISYYLVIIFSGHFKWQTDHWNCSNCWHKKKKSETIKVSKFICIQAIEWSHTKSGTNCLSLAPRCEHSSGFQIENSCFRNQSMVWYIFNSEAQFEPQGMAAHRIALIYPICLQVIPGTGGVSLPGEADHRPAGTHFSLWKTWPGHVFQIVFPFWNANSHSYFKSRWRLSTSNRLFQGQA